MDITRYKEARAQLYGICDVLNAGIDPDDDMLREYDDVVDNLSEITGRDLGLYKSRLYALPGPGGGLLIQPKAILIGMIRLLRYLNEMYSEEEMAFNRMKAVDIQKQIMQIVGELENEESSNGVLDSRVEEIINIDLQVLRDQMELLAGRGLLKTIWVIGDKPATICLKSWLTPLGRTILHDPTYRHEPQVAITTNNLTIINSHIQNLAQLGEGKIEQTVESVPEELLDMIDKLVKQVEDSGIISETIVDYKLECEQLKNELRKKRPDLSRIREIIAFISDSDGVLGLASRIGPVIISLLPHIEHYLHSIFG